MAVWSIVKNADLSINKRMDSEFFQPKYIKAEKSIKSIPNGNLGALGRFIIGPFGSAFHVSNYDPNSQYRYIRGKDVKPFQLLEDDNVYMPEKDFIRLKKYSVQQNDLLISVVGTLGNVAIVPDGEQGIFSCKSTIFRNSVIDPYYLITYLNSSYGKECLLRRQRGAIQTGLNKDDLKTIPVPIFNDEIQKAIGEKIKLSLKLSCEAKTLYIKAAKLLEQELGVDKIHFKNQRIHKASFIELIEKNRFDSEYFKPKYKQLKDLIKSYANGWERFLVNIQYLRPNIDPSKTPSKSYDYIELSDIDPTLGIIKGSCIVTGKEAPSRAKRQILKDDIIASSVVGSVNKSAIVTEAENNFLASTGFFHFRSSYYSPQFLLLLVRSKIITEQLIQESTGGILSAVPDGNLKNLIIPKIPFELQDIITEMVANSHNANKESKRLLELAKTEIETLIEQAAQAS